MTDYLQKIPERDRLKNGGRSNDNCGGGDWGGELPRLIEDRLCDRIEKRAAPSVPQGRRTVTRPF